MNETSQENDRRQVHQIFNQVSVATSSRFSDPQCAVGNVKIAATLVPASLQSAVPRLHSLVSLAAFPLY